MHSPKHNDIPSGRRCVHSTRSFCKAKLPGLVFHSNPCGINDNSLMLTKTLGTCDKSHSCNTKQLCKQIGKCVHSMIKQLMCQGEDDWFAIGVTRFTLRFLLPQEFNVSTCGLIATGKRKRNSISWEPYNQCHQISGE